jgi:xanthine dehydrogenase molybdopterin-binding subunit B
MLFCVLLSGCAFSCRQAPALCQGIAMAVTGLPSNHVNVLNRRSGGAFGGKITRMVPVVASATLGAYVTGKQVHVQLDRSQDMIMVRVSALRGVGVGVVWV